MPADRFSLPHMMTVRSLDRFVKEVMPQFSVSDERGAIKAYIRTASSAAEVVEHRRNPLQGCDCQAVRRLVDVASCCELSVVEVAICARRRGSTCSCSAA